MYVTKIIKYLCDYILLNSVNNVFNRKVTIRLIDIQEIDLQCYTFSNEIYNKYTI
jgi:hypothetical protein